MIARPLGRGGPPVPLIGQGTWHIGEDARARDQEIAALRLGLELGLMHIDTAEMYADGRAEEIVGEAIADRRAVRRNLRAFEASLRHLRTSYMETLVERGLLRHIGVSNFDVSQLEAAQAALPSWATRPWAAAASCAGWSRRSPGSTGGRRVRSR